MAPKITHIYWFAYFNLDEPSVRYRALYALQHLQQQAGLSFDLVYPSYRRQAFLHFCCIYLEVLLGRKKGSVVVFQKIYSRGVYARMLQLLLLLRPQNTLYDIDDAEYVRRRPQTMRFFMKYCSACSVGSGALFDYVFALNKRTFLLSSPVIHHGFERHTSASNRQRELVVGWIGYYDAHRESLMESFFPALRQLDFKVKLVLLGVRRPWEWEEIVQSIGNPTWISLEAPFNIDWYNEQAVYETMAGWDVGVSPLLDDAFNRAKSAFKLKQCLSVGLPVLASATGENAVFLQHGFNGFFCETADDYATQLRVIRQADDATYQAWSTAALAGAPRFGMDVYTQTLLAQMRAMVQR